MNTFTNKYYEVKDNKEIEYNPEPFDFNIISPEGLFISINYKGSNITITCTSQQEVFDLSKEVMRTIEKIEQSANKSILTDVKLGKDQNGRVVEYELRQNLDGSFVILKETFFGSSKIKLPIKEGTLTPSEAIADWVRI